MTPELTLSFHKSFDGYLAKINIPDSTVVKNHKSTTMNPKMIIILDRSGSMGQNVKRLVNIILPKVIHNLGYTDDDKITLITFDTTSEIYEMNISQMKSCNIASRGRTMFKPALQLLNKYLTTFNHNTLRILTISDGMMHDIDHVIKYASSISSDFASNRQINSQAVRYFTSSSQPDTRGLASILQFGNIQCNKLLDLQTSHNDHNPAVNMMSQLFSDDGLAYNIKLTTDNNILSTDPWKTPTNELNLAIGHNLIWFKEIPTKIDIVGINATVKSDISDNINSTNITNIIEHRFNYYLDRIRILKVLNTDESKEEVNEILNYFEKFQTHLNTIDMTQDEKYTPDLTFRFNNLKRNIQQRRKSLYMKLQQLANDDIVSQLNSAQQADYLRGVELSKNTKGLARRAMKTGFDLTEIIHKEVNDMVSHIDELKDIDDTNHKKSFYSMETTLEGINTVCKLATDNILSDTVVTDIIQLINIIGIGCYHVIGDYPDAMAYRVHDLFPGTYISVSDITVVQTFDKHNKLSPPGHPDKEIVSVVPLFDDERIHRFLLNYAPTLLNLSAGVGMRRVLADVPSTHMYTQCAGLWKAIDMVATDRSELLIETIKELTQDYNIAVGTYFDHNEKFLCDQPGKTSYFINNNGLTNTLNLIYRQVTKDNTQNMARIMRALYCYEFYQTIKKLINKADDKKTYIIEQLTSLLQLDYQKYGTKVGELFTETPSPSHDTTYIANTSVLESIIYNFKYFKNCFMVPVIFTALMQEDYVTTIKQLPEITNEYMAQQLELNYTFDQFLLYSAVESIIYHTKQLRVSDKSEQKMNLPDIGYQEEAEKLITTFIHNLYQKSYNSNLRTKTGQEYQIAIEKLVEVATEGDIDAFSDVLQNGYTYRGRFAQIVNTGNQGFMELQQSLLNIEKEVPERFQKITMFIMGKDTSTDFKWNGGNALRVNLQPYENVFKHFHKDELWDKLYGVYKMSVKHIYRGAKEMANRHSHHNEKPSYWALGFKTTKDMHNKISTPEWDNYAQIHNECCGFASTSLYQRKKLARRQKHQTNASSYQYY
jgi:hypothetical protein